MYKLTIIAFIATAFSANAQGYQVNLQGQKQQGMGGAGAALPLDAAAVFFNPASISFLKNSSINLGFTPTFANTLYTDKASNEIGR